MTLSAPENEKVPLNSTASHVVKRKPNDKTKVIFVYTLPLYCNIQICIALPIMQVLDSAHGLRKKRPKKRKPSRRTGGQHPYTGLETLVGKQLSHKLFEELSKMFALVKQDARQTMVGHVLQILSDLQAVLEICVQPQTTENKQTHELVGTEEYDNPEPGSKYWNSNWIGGSCACLFC